jgi:hypothetical protein
VDYELIMEDPFDSFDPSGLPTGTPASSIIWRRRISISFQKPLYQLTILHHD